MRQLTLSECPFLLLSGTGGTTTTTTPDPYAATDCDPSQCILQPEDPAVPGCFCSKDGTRIPGNLDPKEVRHLGKSRSQRGETFQETSIPVR